MTPYLLIAGDFVKTGGMDRSNYALASYLAENGVQTHLVTHRTEPELARHPNVIVHRVPKLARSYVLAAPLLDRIGRVWARRIAARGGKVVANGGNCLWGDVNWIHYVHAAYRRETSGGVAHRIRLRLANRIARTDEHRALQRSRMVITNSNRTRDDLVRRLRIPRSRIRTIYYGTDPTLFRPPSNDERVALRRELGWRDTTPMIVFVGAMGDRRKGFDTVFEACKILCGDPRWNGEVVVIGTGSETSMWLERSRRAGIERRIHFLGFRSDVPAMLRASDAMIAPTRYEAYGLGVHEALCCGLPAFVSSNAGVAERYPPELRDLLLPDPQDVNALVQRLRVWRDNVDYWRERVLPFSRELRRYTWNDMARDIVGLIETGVDHTIAAA